MFRPSSKALRLFVLTVSLGLLILVTGPVTAATFQYRPESNLKFHGVSTIRAWTCDTVPVEGNLELPFRVRDRSDLLARLEGFKPRGILKIPVGEIDCGDSGFFDHNQNLYRTLQGSKYPYVQFAPVVVRDVSWDTGLKGTIVGDLTITDRTRRVEVPLAVDVADSRTLRVSGELTVSLKDYGLEPPQLLLGFIAIYDTVRITIDLRLYMEALEAGTEESLPPDRKPETVPESEEVQPDSEGPSGPPEGS